GAPASARAGDIVLKDAASMSGAILWLSSGAPGLVLAVVRGDESVVLGYGETRPGSKVEPHCGSTLRMGSIAKVIAGATSTPFCAWARSPKSWRVTCSQAWRPTAR